MAELLRIAAAAERLGLKPASLRKLEKAGILRPVRDWANQRRFSSEEIERYRQELWGALSDSSGGEDHAG